MTESNFRASFKFTVCSFTCVQSPGAVANEEHHSFSKPGYFQEKEIKEESLETLV
jgi:hypothetical protein